MITAILPIFNTLQTVNLDRMTIEINITKVVIFIIITIITKMAVSYEEESVIFMAKKLITLASIQMMSNRREKNFEGKTENFMEIKVNIIYF